MRKPAQDAAADAAPPSAESTESAEVAPTVGADVASEPASADVADALPAHWSVAAVEDWFATHFRNMGAQLDGRVYALLHAAKEDLKARLSAR